MIKLNVGWCSRLTLLVGVERLLEEVITGEDHDDGQILIYESKNTVFQLTGHNSLTVKVGNFLDLQSTLKGSRELGTTTKQQKGLLVLERLGAELLNRLVLGEDILDLLRDLGEALHDLLATLLLGCAVLTKGECEHNHGNELGGVGLGGGNTDFGTGVDVDTAVGEQGDGGADDVDDTDSQGTALQAVAESHERVSSLTRLGNEDAGVVTEDRCLSIEEVGCQFNGDGDLGQLFKHTANGHA